VKPTSVSRKAMVADAALLESYNTGQLTTGCVP
jgi:hypothetical protein